MDRPPPAAEAPPRWAFLAPWEDAIFATGTIIKTKPCCDETFRVTIDTIYLNAQQGFLFKDEWNPSLQLLAEAIHLLTTALALYPEVAWRRFFEDLFFTEDLDLGLYDLRAIPLRLEIDCSFYPGEVLMARSGLAFFQVLLDSTARSPAFHDAMQQLTELSQSSGPPFSRPPPLALQIDLSLWNEYDETMMLGFIDFVRTLQPFGRAYCDTAPHPWCFVDEIVMDLIFPLVSRDALDRASVLAAQAPFVRCQSVVMAPRDHDMHYQNELLTMLYAVRTTSPDVRVILGDITTDVAPAFDADGSDNSNDEKAMALLVGLSRLPACIKHLGVGHLMSKAPVEGDRRHIVWVSLFGAVLSPSSLCTIDTLSLSSPRVLNNEADAALIQQVTTRAPHYKIPRRLELELVNADAGSVRAIVTAFGSGLRELALSTRGPPLPAHVVEFIVESCPHLACLSLDNVEISSMELFYSEPSSSGGHGSRLTRLALRNVVLHLGSSLTTFLNQLADPQTRLGSHLREFVYDRREAATDLWDNSVLVYDQLQCIHRILHANRRVECLQLGVMEGIDPGVIESVAREHCPTPYVRQGPLALPAKLALLSVASRHALSADELRPIFEFAADCWPRFVQIIPRRVLEFDH